MPSDIIEIVPTDELNSNIRCIEIQTIFDNIAYWYVE